MWGCFAPKRAGRARPSLYASVASSPVALVHTLTSLTLQRHNQTTVLHHGFSTAAAWEAST